MGTIAPPPPIFFLYIYINASIYNVLSLAICFNKFTFYPLIILLIFLKAIKKFIDKLTNISLRANLRPNIQTNPLKATKTRKKEKTKQKKLKPILTTREHPHTLDITIYNTQDPKK